MTAVLDGPPSRSGAAAVRPVTSRHWRSALSGVLDMAPFIVGYAPFALIVGSAVADSPDPAAGLAATWLLYGGSVHLAVLRLMEEGAGMLAIVVTGLLVNTRLVLYSATVAPLWRDEPRRFVAVAAALLVEPTWTLARARHDRPGTPLERRYHYLGAAGSLWLAWSALIVVGMLVGGRAGTTLGLDLAVPICLLAVVTPSLRHRPGAAAAAAGATVAVLGQGLPSGASILLAVGAGLVAGQLADRGRS